MRSFSLLILLLGAAVSEPIFRSGKEYIYEYQGKLLSGIPELESQFAGLVIKGKIILQTLDTETYKLALKDVKYSKFNKRMTGTTENSNWRHLITPEVKEVPSEFEAVLKSPIEFSMINGVVSKIKVSQNEPTWAINLKKSLVSLIKIKTPTGEQELTQNTIVRAKSLASLPPVWKVMEEGVDGKCENVYDIAELPEYLLEQIAPGLVDTKKCEGKKIYQILKTRNMDKCVEQSVFSVSQLGSYLCPLGNCESMWEKSSITRYIACGPSKEDLEIQLIINEGELQQSLLAYNTENVVTGTKQNLTLIEVTSTKTTLPKISSPVTLEDLYYVYPKVGREMLKTEERKEYLQNLPLTEKSVLTMIQTNEGILSKLSPATLKQKIIEKLTKIAKELKETERFEEKQVSLYVLSVSKVISLLGTEEIKTLYEEVRKLSLPVEIKETIEQLVLEVTVISGTNPAIMFVKEMILSEKISPLRIGTIIASLPHYIVTPTVKLLDELFEIIKSPVVTRHEILKSNAELSFATLLNRACIDSSRVSRFPVFVYGEFCNSQTSTLINKYIPYLVDQLHSARTEVERVSIIMSLGTLGHESVIPILLPYIEGKQSVLEQRMAIYALIPIAMEHSEVLLPIASAIVYNPTEEKTVRIAALTMLLKTQPSLVHFQKLATSTWFEKDIEFQKFVYSTLKSLSEIEVTEQPSFKTTLYHNSLKAKVVMPLVKPVPVVISSTLNTFTAEWLKELEVGYHLNSGYTTTGLMKHVYGKLEFFLEQLEFTPIELCLHLQGTGKLVQLVNKVFGTEIENKIHPEWRKMISTLNMRTSEETPFIGGVWTRLVDDVQFIHGVDAREIEPLLRKIKETVMRPETLKQKICGKTPINMVKVNNIKPTTVLVPSEMGLPILIEASMPSVLSTEGYINIECSKSLPSLELSLTNKLSNAFTGYVGTVCPFTKEVISTGIAKEWTVNYPTTVVAGVESGKVKVVLKPTEQAKSSSEIDLLSYTVTPFTTIKPVLAIDVTPMTAHPGVKIIRSESEHKTIEETIGEKIGLNLKYLIKTDSEVTDIKSVIDVMSLYKYNPINVLLFGGTLSPTTLSGYPSSKYFVMKFVYSPSRSETKELETELQLGAVYKKHSYVIEYKPEHFNVLAPKQVLQQLSVESGVAVTGEMKVLLKGSSRPEYIIKLIAGHGFTGMEQKWKLHLESPEKAQICVDGKISMPSVSMRNTRELESQDLRLTLKNVIGFGRTCEEYTIKIDGTSSVSQEQKQFAMRSTASKRCERITREVEEIKEKLRKVTRETPEFIPIEKELERLTEEKIEYCTQQLKELSTLDSAKFNIKYTGIPKIVKEYSRVVDVALKTVLLPYMTGYETRESHNEIIVDLKFIPHERTVNMVLTTEEGTVKYHNIRIPTIIRDIIPVAVADQPIVELISSIRGSPLYPLCRIGDDVVKSFDNSTYSYELDGCYHVLVAEGEKPHSFAVLGKETEGKKEVKLYVNETEIELKPTRSYSVQNKEYEIIVDGQPIQLKTNERKVLPTKSPRVVLKLIRSPDNVLILETPYLRVIYDGEVIEIKETGLFVERELRGLCGANNGDKRFNILTPKSLVAPSPQAAAISFRVGESCPTLTKRQEIYKKQLRSAHKPIVERTKVSQIIKSKLESCSQMRHSTVWQGTSFCISQIPVMQCGGGCAPRSMVTKPVPYTCLPSSRERVIKLYEEKVRRGDVLPELRNMEKTFTSKMYLPVTCTHPGL